MTFNESTSNQIDTRELTNHINKTKRVLLMAYESMVPQRYKQEAKEIQMRLDKLERECKYNDLSRAKREVGLWKNFITKIISQTNRGIWLSGTDGRKYKSVVDTFEKLVGEILGEIKKPVEVEPTPVNPTEEIEKQETTDSEFKLADDKAVGALNLGDSEIRGTQKERFLRLREKRGKRLGKNDPSIKKQVGPFSIKRFDSIA